MPEDRPQNMPEDEGSRDEAKYRIRNLVNEMATLSRSDVSSQIYFDQFLIRLVEGLAAKGGAVWMLEDSGDLKLQSQVNLHKTRLAEVWVAQDIEDQRRHNRVLQHVLSTNKGLLVQPNATLAEDIEATNPTDFLLVLGPLSHGQQVRGVIEVFQRPGGPPPTQRGYWKFLLRMCELAGDYLKRNFPTDP